MKRGRPSSARRPHPVLDRLGATGSLVCAIHCALLPLVIAVGMQFFFVTMVLGAAAHHGRILVLDSTSAKESTGHGSPMPQLVHGGPGRAGGGDAILSRDLT